ncbi:MAG: hypothetical protein MUE60_09610, partial [Candidatus Eisenbacteria bacterium]|nr:hypothetical protein [Candidatus Eisenbacteria bacterium]
MPFLRMGSLALVLLLVADAVLPVPARRARDWAVVVDGSLSMAVEDSLGVCRATRGLRALPSRGADAPVLVTGSAPTLLDARRVEDGVLDGQFTDLAAMIRTAATMLPSLRRIILISDGRSGGTDPVTDAQLIGLEVSCIGVGAGGEAADLAITDVLAPSVVMPDQEIPITVSLRLNGSDHPVVAKVLLEVAGSPVVEDPITMTPDSTMRVDLACPALDPGNAEIRVIADPLEGERSTANNEALVNVAVRAALWKVHIASERPAWDLAFITRELRKDGGFEVTLRTPGTTASSASGSLPDVLVVGEWGESGGPAQSEEAIQVLDRGGAVILLGWPSAGEWGSISPLLAAPEPGTERRLVPSGTGDHPVVAALGDPGHAPVTFPGGPVSVSPGATVLLKTEAGTPALAVHSRGRGQVLAWLGADWWRWYLAESGAAEPSNPWPRVLRWLLSPDAGRRLRLHFSKEPYASGEPIPVGVEVFSPGWEPAQEGWAELEVRSVGEAVAFSRRVALGPGNRMPEVEIPGLAGGAWEIQARAELPGGDRLTADSRIVVSHALPEHALLHPDHRSLARLA